MSHRTRAASSLWTSTILGGILAAPGLALAGEAAAGHDHCHPAASSARAAEEAAPTPEAAPVRYVRSERSYAVPDVTLVDEHEGKVRLAELLSGDAPVLVNFVFTTCRAICPVMSRIFASVQKELGREAGTVRLVSISIDPEQDTPERLRAYAARFGAQPGWRFLTGSIRDVEAVERAFDAYRGDKMNHEPLTLLRRGRAGPWIRIEGFASPADLAREYQKVAMR